MIGGKITTSYCCLIFAPRNGSSWSSKRARSISYSGISQVSTGSIREKACPEERLIS